FKPSQIMNRVFFIYIALTATGWAGLAQDKLLTGLVKDKKNFEPVPAVSVYDINSTTMFAANDQGSFRIRTMADTVRVVLSATGFKTDTVILVAGNKNEFYLQPETGGMREVVVTGTMRTVQKTASPVPVELYTPRFFLKNPTPTIFDALQMVNGVRPQLNCNVCNTGDIHMNGLEGPYTMVLIHGMPIMSALASV